MKGTTDFTDFTDVKNHNQCNLCNPWLRKLTGKESKHDYTHSFNG